MSARKAIRVRTEIPEAKQLQVFVRSLGSSEPAELYMVGNLAYINIDLLLPILSVAEKWFLNNATECTGDTLDVPHYVRLKKGIYVNKYGITKLIAQSKEAVAFKLQDYIYEVIYKLEKNGTVSMGDIESRKELERAITNYQEVQSRNLEELKEYEDEIRRLELTIYELTTKNEQLNVDCKHKDELIEEYEDEISKLMGICRTLGKYVKKKKPESTIIDDLELECSSDEDITVQEASDANDMFKKSKKSIKKIKEKGNEWKRSDESKKDSESKKSDKQDTQRSGSSKIKNAVKYLIRSNEPFYQDAYRWSIKTEMPKNSINTLSIDHEEMLYDTYKEYSKAVLRGECISNPSYMFIHYADLHIDQRSTKIVTAMLAASVFRTEDIDIIISQNGW